MRQLDIGMRRWVTKQASENCGVGITLVHWNKQTSNACPRCGVPENTLHVLQCRGSQADEVALEHMTKLQNLFDNTFTHPDIASAIMSRLTHFRHRTQPHLPPSTSFEIIQATLSQDRIGWKNFIEGLLSVKWRQAQSRYYRRQSISSISSRQWLSKLLSRLYKMGHALWEHRNKVLHNPNSQYNCRMLQQLHQEIIHEYHRGAENLPPRDRGRFLLPLGDILTKPIAHKQAWLLNVPAARDAEARRQMEQADLRSQSLQRNQVYQWILSKSTPPLNDA
jgi:hypothetical protein